MCLQSQLSAGLFRLAILAGASLILPATGRCQSVALGAGNPMPAPAMPETLRVFSEIPLSVPSFGYLGTAECDDSGTMFFAAATPPRTGVTYLSISADGQKQTVYAMPKYIDENPYNTLFSVPPDGRLQLLFVVPGEQPPKWLSFDKKGELDRVVTLAAPAAIDVRSFTTTAQGYLLLVGYYPPTKAHGKNDGETYTGIFNPNGDLVARLASEDAGLQANGEFAGPPQEPAAVEGEQFFWISSSGKDLVVTATDGSIVRRLPLSGARPGDRVVGLRVSGNQALVTYINLKATPRLSYLLLNASTGDRYGLFLQPAGIRGGMTCYDSSRGFTFLSSSSSGHVDLVRSLLP